MCEAHINQIRRYGGILERPVYYQRPNAVTPNNRNDVVAKLLWKQNGQCAICGKSNVDEWHLDHDHSCCPGGGWPCMDCVRGVLCRPCNLGLGMFQESTKVVAAALKYLSRSQLSKPTLFAVGE